MYSCPEAAAPSADQNVNQQAPDVDVVEIAREAYPYDRIEFSEWVPIVASALKTGEPLNDLTVPALDIFEKLAKEFGEPEGVALEWRDLAHTTDWRFQGPGFHERGVGTKGGLGCVYRETSATRVIRPELRLL